MSKADVSDAFRSVRRQTQMESTILLHGRESGSNRLPPRVRVVRVAGFWGVIRLSVEHAHYNTMLTTTQIPC